jgi:hypothetical protein
MYLKKCRKECVQKSLRRFEFMKEISGELVSSSVEEKERSFGHRAEANSK